MLKRLQLVGFKSFADPTAFDFPSGVTGIVGPNGSGKSNVVDAVRWVLGEQSAKSLRGGEMTDVIFNGSSSRRSLGLAEVTMTFDNSRRTLATDADEVQVTRRVYRSGEGEYLIGGQPCRLKDIKDLFLGSGAGSDAYCVIEQGRVDVLLQASTKERRTIFEEAAGISRFKAKKTESLRRLERVDQNLQRLRDILDEVEKQLRSVKLQAAKAERYQEYARRLRSLRTTLGLREYRQLSKALEQDGAVLDRLRAELDAEEARATEWERDLNRFEEELTRLDTVAHGQEAELAAAREQIASGETTLAHEGSLAGDVEADLAHSRQRLADLTRQVVALSGAVDRADWEVRTAEGLSAVARAEVDRMENELRCADERLVALHAQIQADKDAHLERMRQSSRLQNDAVGYKAQVDNLARERGRLRLRSEQAAEHLASLDLELDALIRADETLQTRLTEARRGLADTRAERDRLREAQDAAGRSAADLREQRSGVASRVEVLEGLERSHEGLGTGVREVFALRDGPNPGPWSTVLGLVADFLTVRREYAPLIDLALGERAQRFLVTDAGLLAEALRQHGQAFSGRVSFLPVPAETPGPVAEPPADAPLVAARKTSGPPPSSLEFGIVALAEQVVRCDAPNSGDLPRRLLGRTLIVRNLEAARAVAGRGFRCVTLRGELLETDGTLTVGTYHAEAGLLSRKSELRELRDQAAVLDWRVAETEHDLADLRERLASLDGRAESQQRELDVLTEQASDLRTRLERHRERRAGLNEEVEVSRSEISVLEVDIGRLEGEWHKAAAAAAAAETEVQTLQVRITESERNVREGDGQRQHRQTEVTAARVAQAQVNERLADARAQLRRLETELHQRELERQQVVRALAASRARLDDTERKLLEASATLALAYSRKESSERLLSGWVGERDRLRKERKQLGDATQASRTSWRVRQEKAHALELSVNGLRHRRDDLCARLREDYQLELAEMYQATADDATSTGSGGTVAAGGAALDNDPDPPTDAEAGAEIEELRRKLGRLGSVNLEALQELGELEGRSRALQLQFDDLAAAQRALQDIIAKINGDSRRLFTETFTTIRTHFQELFRKLFGGGIADVVLEDESDVLESGIEVIARPPGKELRSISLMSGGEKTMTAVALLLAIFRSRPSPFCILDEVDAALDEANIGRFTAVLRDFLDRSQFILITHSKRTMTVADVLYGVTMQESGVSRRVAVRFEDWPDDERKGEEPAA